MQHSEEKKSAGIGRRSTKALEITLLILAGASSAESIERATINPIGDLKESFVQIRMWTWKQMKYYKWLKIWAYS